jgi:hypothetical protein
MRWASIVYFIQSFWSMALCGADKMEAKEIDIIDVMIGEKEKMRTLLFFASLIERPRRRPKDSHLAGVVRAASVFNTRPPAHPFLSTENTENTPYRGPASAAC